MESWNQESGFLPLSGLSNSPPAPLWTFALTSHRQEVVKVCSPEARKIVSDKYNALLQQRNANPPPARPAAAPARYPPPPPPQYPGKGAAKGKPQSKESWLDSLPQNELTGEEVDLRQALLDWLKQSSQRRSAGKGKWAAPLMGEVMNDPRIAQCRAALLPPNVSLKDWIEARVGGEIELKNNVRGQVEVMLAGEGHQERHFCTRRPKRTKRTPWTGTDLREAKTGTATSGARRGVQVTL
eukprot:g28165.t1